MTKPRLPIALGAAIEVQALALAGQGKRSEAIMTLQREIEQYKGTSIIMRLNKNMNLLSLEGQPAFPIESQEWLGPKTLARRAQGQAGGAVPVGALVRRLQDAGTDPRRARATSTRARGITVVAPTQRFGYVEKRKPAGPAEELAYIERIRDQFYPWMKTVSAPVSDDALPEVRRLDDADLRDDRSRRQGVVVPAGTADVGAARSR